MMFSSCIGQFALTNKLLSWNQQVGSKFVNELVFFAFWILPVYEVSALADILVINSIEFWSGSNPMACGKTVIEGQTDDYLVECDGKGYTITSENDGSVVRMDFDAEDQAWSVVLPDGESYEFLTFVDDTHVKMPGRHAWRIYRSGAFAARRVRLPADGIISAVCIGPLIIRRIHGIIETTAPCGFSARRRRYFGVPRLWVRISACRRGVCSNRRFA